jgi:hypothetical protein
MSGSPPLLLHGHAGVLVLFDPSMRVNWPVYRSSRGNLYHVNNIGTVSQEIRTPVQVDPSARYARNPTPRTIELPNAEAMGNIRAAVADIWGPHVDPQSVISPSAWDIREGRVGPVHRRNVADALAATDRLPPWWVTNPMIYIGGDTLMRSS